MRRRTSKSKDRLIREAKETEKKRLASGWVWITSENRSMKLVKKSGNKKGNKGSI